MNRAGVTGWRRTWAMWGLALICPLFMCALSQAQQQDKPFYAEIESFLRSDSVAFPKKGGILFVGSSSIGGWADLEARLHDYAVIRRGFGGRSYADILAYIHEIVLPYRPAKLFLYAGENDLVQGKTVESIMNTFAEIHRNLREELPYTDVYVIATKPSIKLQAHRAAIAELNKRIKAYALANAGAVHYVDVHDAMLDASGELKPGLFVSDNLHLNAAGYDIWEQVIRQFL